ncbi:MAG: methyltransferase, partial [Bacteroidales bacterium]
HGQLQHLLLVLVLVPGGIALVKPGLTGGFWLGVSDRQWTFGLMAVVVIHQFLVLLVWRSQLCFGTFSRLFGRADLAVWMVVFLPFLLARVVMTIAVAISTPGTLDIPVGVGILLGTLLLVPAVYTFWSTFRYFGLVRAAGGDHFRTRYRAMPLVEQGAFRYSSNAMYTFGLLILWTIALLAQSRAALAMAMFQHAYIWVHLYCTEAPDLKVLYGDANDANPQKE